MDFFFFCNINGYVGNLLKWVLRRAGFFLKYNGCNGVSTSACIPVS